MSDQPQTEPQRQPPQPGQEPEEHEEKEVEEKEAAGNGADTNQLYHKICAALQTECATDETPDEFKSRVVNEFSNMTVWPNEKYEALPQDVQDWVYDATMTLKGNATKKRKKNMPVLSGLDVAPTEKKKRGRASLVDEPKRGRTRSTGEDCLTRTMKLLVVEDQPENIKAVDLVKSLDKKYKKEYSVAAVRYAQQAFLTAREILAKQAAAQ